MEKAPSRTVSCSPSFSAFIGIVLLHRILNWVYRIQEFYSVFLSLFQSRISLFFFTSTPPTEQTNLRSELPGNNFCLNEKEDDRKLCREDVVMVMERLGIFVNPDAEMSGESSDSDDLTAMFDEEEPSLEEVKEAFDVFDENRDGFVDAGELGRVLCCLGLREGLKVEECERMMRAFDKNGDGRIDFVEFVKLMETSFC